MSCSDCHRAVTADNSSIANRKLHINNQRDIAFSGEQLNFSSDSLTCSGSCHNKAHPGYTWVNSGGAGYHPEGFADPEQHGVAMVLQRSDCRGCHGSDLGGGAGDSCDACHGGGNNPAWRSDCTFCHGGSDNSSGAPPHDLGTLEQPRAKL